MNLIYCPENIFNQIIRICSKNRWEGKKSFNLVRIENADHSMNIPDDLEASLNTLGKVTEEIIKFVTSSDEVNS